MDKNLDDNLSEIQISAIVKNQQRLLLITRKFYYQI